MLNNVHAVHHVGQVVRKAVGGLSRSPLARDLSLSFSPSLDRYFSSLSPKHSSLITVTHPRPNQCAECKSMQHKVNTIDSPPSVSMSVNSEGSVMRTADDKTQLCADERVVKRKLKGSVSPNKDKG